MRFLKVILLLICVSVAQLSQANVRVHGLFGSHMVVQQKSDIPVWGWAAPNEKIVVVCDWGAEAEVVTAADSTWHVEVKTPKAGGPYTITITGENTMVLDDVWSGEVWFCSGQSNMDFEMYRFVNDAREELYQPLVEMAREEVATANDRMIRHIEVPQQGSMYVERKDIDADWRMAVKGDVDTISAIGYYFAKELRKHMDVPVGIIECAWGGTRIEPWLAEGEYMKDETMRDFFVADRKILEARRMAMSKDDYVDTAYIRKKEYWLNNKDKVSKPYPAENPTTCKQTPATCYNGMVAAVLPYKVKGVLWYQGESNSHFHEDEYEAYLKTLVNSWRQAWDDEDLPFYWAQIANYHVDDHRSDMGWAMVSDAQRRALDLPHTGMAVLNDIGESRDVHPHNKMDAGMRLANIALKHNYGVKLGEVSGPLYSGCKIKDDKIIVQFTHVDDGLMVAKKVLMNIAVEEQSDLHCFEVCDAQGVWYQASARIVSRNRVEVYSGEVKHPLHVRYAWESNPQGANLYNTAGLPTSVFTTQE